MARTQSLQVVDQPRRAAQPQQESPRSRLQRIGPDRVAKAVRAVRHLQQLANPAVYELRAGDRDKIVSVLNQEIEQLDFVLAHPGKSAPIVRFDDEDESG